MISKSCKLFFLLLSLFLTQSLLANPAPLYNFDPVSANQRLTQYNTEFLTKPTNIRQLETTITDLNQLQAEAKKCVDTAQVELNQINTQLQGIIPKEQTNIAPSAEQIYLQNKRDQLLSRLSDCRLFLLRSEETRSKYSSFAHELATRQLFAVEPDLIAKIITNVQLIGQLPRQFNFLLFKELSGIEQLNIVTTTIFIILILAAIAIGIKLRAWLSLYIAPESKLIYPEKFFQASLCVLKKYVIPLLVLLFIVLFATLLSVSITPLPYLTLISYALLGYLIFIILTRLFLYPPEPAQPLINMTPTVGRALQFRLQLLALLLVVSLIIYILFHDQNFPLATRYFARTIFISLLAINLISIVWLINRAPKLLYFHPTIRSVLSFILGISLISILVIEWLGYHGIAFYLLTGIVLTLVIIFIAWTLLRILINAVNTLSGDQHPWQQHLHAELGLKVHEPIPELIWLKIFVYILIWSGLIVALLKVWGLSRIYFREITDILINGFTLGRIQIIPIHILFALLIFTLLIAATRWVRTRIMKSPQLEVAPGAREALATIARYSGFILALVIALIVAGVNFAGLAIIAGALSVGIGFGLQNIVNNFVSGIILLIERPIKPGDRIIVGGTEGYVKKINIRFTQLETAQKADVIVPNAELTSQQVTNLMYRDHYSRFSIHLTIPYDSDVELVKNVLLDVANSNPAVIKDYPANEPKVELKQLSTTGLEIELSCLIQNVNDQGTIRSNIHFAIMEAFRQHHIVVAFPQQDIHIRDWPARD